MPKLNQILAIVSGKKTSAQRAITEVYKLIQKPVLFEGISRTYKPTDEEGETCPEEKKKVQYTTEKAVTEFKTVLEDLFSIVATQDSANQKASASIVVDGVEIVKDVPVTHLLFLEKQLTDIRTFVDSLPVLDPSETWKWNASAGSYANEPTGTNRTKKVPRNHVLAEATEVHPAQVNMYTEDVKVGEWKTIKFSGAMLEDDKSDMLSRVVKLQEAIKFAREEANSTEVTLSNSGGKILDFVFSEPK